MKRVLLCFISLITYHLSFSQSWMPVGNAIQDTGTIGNSIAALYVYNGELYAGGQFYGHCPTNNIEKWDGTAWSTVGSGVKDTCILAITSYDSMLYVGGQFYQAGNVEAKAVAQWNGTAWDSVGCGITIASGVEVVMTTVYNGELYTSGNFTTIANGLKVNGIARWNGIKWDSVGKGLHFGEAWCATVWNGKLYVAGQFDSAGNVAANNIASWDGANWDSLGGGIKVGYIRSISVYNGKLYVGGTFTTAGGKPVNNIACWDGIKWDSLAGGITGTINPIVQALAAYNGNLYASGFFDSAGRKPALQVAKWNGIQWSAVGAGLTGPNYIGIVALCAYDSSLYAGGDFTKSGITSLTGIARWRDSVILGTEQLKIKNYELKIYPNPANTTLNIEAQLSQGEAAHICLYNSIGQLVQCEELQNNITPIPTSALAEGIYYYRVIDQNGTLLKANKQIITH